MNPGTNPIIMWTPPWIQGGVNTSLLDSTRGLETTN